MNFTNLQREFKEYALVQRGIRPASYKVIVSAMQKLTGFASSENISELTTAIVQGYLLKTRQEKAWSPKTFRNIWQCFKTFFDWCIKAGYLSDNPVKHIERPRLPLILPRCISHEDAKKVLYHATWYSWKSEIEKQRNMSIISTLMMTGLRLQELLNLEATEVDLANGNIFVRQGKGRRDRNIPIYPKLLPVLRAYQRTRQMEGRPSRWFFTGFHSDKQLYPKDARRICKKIGLSAGVKFTPHMLRHTFARELADNDFDVMKIKELLGHAQVTTTQRYIALSSQRVTQFPVGGYLLSNNFFPLSRVFF